MKGNVSFNLKMKFWGIWLISWLLPEIGTWSVKRPFYGKIWSQWVKQGIGFCTSSSLEVNSKSLKLKMYVSKVTIGIKFPLIKFGLISCVWTFVLIAFCCLCFKGRQGFSVTNQQNGYSYNFQILVRYNLITYEHICINKCNTF